MSIKSVNFSSSVAEVDRKKTTPDPQSEVCSLIEGMSLLSVPEHGGRQHRAGGQEQRRTSVLQLAPMAVSRDTQRSSRVHPASACWNRPSRPTLLEVGSAFPPRKLRARRGRVFVGVRGAPPVGRQHHRASELLKTQRNARGIRAAFSGVWGEVCLWGGCLVTHVKIGISVL